MTIGERIRFFRKQLGITQEELAQRAELHPVSVRKYEINKMTPQFDQLKRIARALDVNYSALAGIDRTVFSLSTMGDLLGLVIILCQSKVIVFSGKRQEDGLLAAETVRVKLSEKLYSYFSSEVDCEDSSRNISLDKIAFMFNVEEVIPDLLLWEREYIRYRKLYGIIINNPTREQVEEFDICRSRKEILELELQNRKEKLMWPDGLVGDIF